MQDNLFLTQPIDVKIDVAPVYNILGSITLVAEAVESPGVADWAVRVGQQLSEHEWRHLKMITKFMGVESLTRSAQQIGSFPDFLDHLAAEDPVVLRDYIVTLMIERPGKRLLYAQDSEHVEGANPSQILQNSQAFATFSLGEKQGDEEWRTLAESFYSHLIDPPSLLGFLVDYLKQLWVTHLQDEWAKQEPWLNRMVQSAVFPDTSGLGHFEIIEAITRRNLRGIYRPEVLNTYRRLCFIPSPHCGPYVMRFTGEMDLRMIFDANLLRSFQPGPSMTSNELLVNKLNALGDETRLNIVRLLKAHGELSTQAIIDGLGLSKAAASRHLRQLYANNIVIIRVADDGLTKHYRLNPDFSHEMQQIIVQLLS